jgi:hypothetical protein
LFVLAMFRAQSQAAVAFADTYWFDFEFNDPNDLPQGDGWLRRCQPQPFGVVHDGTLTYESTDQQMYDFWEYSRPGALDPGPNGVFLIEWRLGTEVGAGHGVYPCPRGASDPD